MKQTHASELKHRIRDVLRFGYHFRKDADIVRGRVFDRLPVTHHTIPALGAWEAVKSSVAFAHASGFVNAT